MTTARKTILPLFIALAVISLVGIAEAKTVKISEAYQNGIWLYGNERLYIVNDDHLPHSITEQNKLFDTTILWPNQLTDFEKLPDGDYVFYDSTDRSKNATLHVRSTEIAPPKLTVDRPAITAGNTILIKGTDFGTVLTHLQVLLPDGSIMQDLQVTPTSEGMFETPFITQRTDANGVYKVVEVLDPSNFVYFVVSGGVTPDNPIEEAPVTPAPEPTAPIEDDTPAPTPQPTPSPTNSTNTTPDTTKQSLIAWLKQQIAYYEQLLAIVEAS